MSAIAGLRPRVLASVTPRGHLEGELAIGAWTIRYGGLDADLAAALAQRWGSFWRPAGSAAPDRTVDVVRGGFGPWLPPGPPGEAYRLEAEAGSGGVLAASYHFALAQTQGSWRLAIADGATEPVGRTVENATRFAVSRLAAESGGLALHGAGVLRRGRAFVFAGPSRSGKTTAVSLSAPGASLGDDFAIVVPGASSWVVPAVPFDNSERGPASSAPPPAPLGGIFRLHHAATPRLARPAGPLAHAGLMACLAFPWALPDLAGKIDEAVASLVAAGMFGELRFARDPSFWELLDP